MDLNDPKLKSIIYDFVYTIDYWIDYFNEKKCNWNFIESSNVRLLGMIGKVANKYFNIPVYSVTNTYIKKNRGLENHYKHVKDILLDLPILFSKISNDQKKIAIDWSKKQLDKRLGGEVGVDMFYSSESAFGSHLTKRALSESYKTKILICTHEFHDNPHSTGGLLFLIFMSGLNIWVKNQSKVITNGT